MDPSRTVAIGSDHAGVDHKTGLVEALSSDGWIVVDHGTTSKDSCDYPDFARRVCNALGRGDAAWGILVCGSGVGMAISANKFPRVRAAVAYDEEVARLSRAHNDCNVLALGARLTSDEAALAIARTFLATPFEGGRHARRVAKIRIDCAYPYSAGVTVFDHPLVQHKLTILRDCRTEPKLFGETILEISSLMAYEITRDLAVARKDVVTTLGETAAGNLIRGEELTVIPILRSGLGMSQGISRVIPMAPVGHIGLSRLQKRWEPYICRLPANLEERTLMVAKPLLGDGEEVVKALDLLKERGARRIKFNCILAVPEGIGNVQSVHPDVEIFAAGVDEGIDEQGNTLPGVGNVGYRMFGT